MKTPVTVHLWSRSSGSWSLPRSFKSRGRILQRVTTLWCFSGLYVIIKSFAAPQMLTCLMVLGAVRNAASFPGRRRSFSPQQPFPGSGGFAAMFPPFSPPVSTTFQRQRCAHLLSCLSGISRVACSYLTSGVEWVICYLDRSVKQRRCAR